MMRIFVANYEHKYGNDLRAFAKAELAEEWRQRIALEWYESELDKEPPPDGLIAADDYFDRVDEYFSVSELEIEGATP